MENLRKNVVIVAVGVNWSEKALASNSTNATQCECCTVSRKLSQDGSSGMGEGNDTATAWNNPVSEKISKQVYFYFFRSDRKRTANGTERTANEPRTDTEQTPNGPRTNPNGSRTNPERAANEPRTDPERTLNGPRTDRFSWACSWELPLTTVTQL